MVIVKVIVVVIVIVTIIIIIMVIGPWLIAEPASSSSVLQVSRLLVDDLLRSTLEGAVCRQLRQLKGGFLLFGQFLCAQKQQ